MMMWSFCKIHAHMPEDEFMQLTPAFYLALRVEHKEHLHNMDLMLATVKALLAHTPEGSEPLKINQLLTFPTQGKHDDGRWHYDTPEELQAIVEYERKKALKLKEQLMGRRRA